MERTFVVRRSGKTALMLAFVAAVVLMAGGVALPGVAGPAGAQTPSQGGKMLFVNTELPSLEVDLQTMDPDGSDRVPFSPTLTDAHSPEWSPDGTKFAYARTSGGISVSSADGTERTPVPNTEDLDALKLSWSPDGTKIAFSVPTIAERFDPEAGEYFVNSSDIYTVNLDGSNLTNLRNGVPPEKGFYWPSWSPDGSEVAFVLWEEPNFDPSFPGTRQEIHTVNADGTGQPTALPIPAYGAMPDWSPDGSKIAYMAFDDVASDGITGFDVYVMNADGSEQRKVTTDGDSAISGNGAVAERDPDWSPDGTKIAYSGRFRVTPCPQNCEQVDIFTVGLDGSGPTNTTDTNERHEAVPSWGPVAPDISAPKVETVNPTNGARGTSRGTNLRAAFSERMDPASITKATFRLYKCSTNCGAQVTNVRVGLSADGLRATLNPYGGSSTRLSPKTKYKAVVTAGAKDTAGNALDQDASMAGNQPKAWYFVTGR